VPLVVRWTGHVRPGSTTDLPCASWDLLPTLAELAGTEGPQGLDGISLVPTLLGETSGRKQPRHEYLYWEFYERGYKQAVRAGDWKAVRFAAPERVELFDLSRDVGETQDIAGQHPDVVRRLTGFMQAAHRPSSDWPQPAAK
jgi:arylsulfatase A-like enzyme